jgi:ribosomal protein L40E
VQTLAYNLNVKTKKYCLEIENTMFCPKCGTENPESGKFCRSCGIDLGNVSAVVSGKLTAQPMQYLDHRGRIRSNDPNHIYSSAIRSLVMGIGFLAIAIVLLTTNAANGQKWWWAMLFPAFSMLATGASQLARTP